MSEKRFYVETVAVRDKVITDKDKFYSYEDLDEIVALLNEQQATISQLEKNFDDLVKWASAIAKRNVVLDEQIGQLQRENEQLKINLNEYGIDFSTFDIFKESIGYNEMIKSSSIKNKKVVR